MKKVIPVYILLLAILGVFVFQLRETKAMRAELAGIRNEQLKQLPSGRPSRPDNHGIPVYVTNSSLDVSISR